MIEFRREAIRTWILAMFHLEHHSFDLLFIERCREDTILFCCDLWNIIRSNPIKGEVSFILQYINKLQLALGRSGRSNKETRPPILHLIGGVLSSTSFFKESPS